MRSDLGNLFKALGRLEDAKVNTQTDRQDAGGSGQAEEGGGGG